MHVESLDWPHETERTCVYCLILQCFSVLRAAGIRQFESFIHSGRALEEAYKPGSIPNYPGTLTPLTQDAGTNPSQ
jgi:hypothetical protein